MVNKSNKFITPDWAPKVPEGSRLLIVGASGGIGSATLEMLSHSKNCIIGAHYQNNKNSLQKNNIIPLKKTLKSDKAAKAVKAKTAVKAVKHEKAIRIARNSNSDESGKSGKNGKKQ